MKVILVLSAGRRVELVKCFKNAADRIDKECQIIAADMSHLAPALYFADKFKIVPAINSGKYIDSILRICKEENVDLVVPTIDTELILLSENKEYIEKNCNAKMLISDIDIIRLCRDKIKTSAFFKDNGFLSPKNITKNDMDNKDYSFPLFIKPLDGSSSINAFKVNNESELVFFRKYIDNPIVQECIIGEEYTVDVFCDFNGKIISIIPRLRIAIRSGEILKGRIVRDNEIIQDVKRLISILKPIGHITVQCMKTDRGVEYIEINPRFGGGAPMSIKAGADSCEYLIRLLYGEKLEYSFSAKENLTFSRFDDCICLNEYMEKIND